MGVHRKKKLILYCLSSTNRQSEHRNLLLHATAAGVVQYVVIDYTICKNIPLYTFLNMRYFIFLFFID